MTNTNISQNTTQNQDFDAIAYEVKHYEAFCQSQTDESFYYGCKDSFSDGSWDAHLLNEPEHYQWLSADYRNGYLFGIQEKFDTKFC